MTLLRTWTCLLLCLALADCAVGDDSPPRDSGNRDGADGGALGMDGADGTGVGPDGNVLGTDAARTGDGAQDVATADGSADGTDAAIPDAATGRDAATTDAALPGDGGVAAQMIATGGDHACAVMTDGTARCWGDNLHGQLGDGTMMSSWGRPVSVRDLGGTATQLAAGRWHSCALLAGGAARCWGYNYVGQLGDGTITDAATPVPVRGLGGTVTQLAANAIYTCALLADGTARCWGHNYGAMPVPVTGLSGTLAQLAAGGAHTCARLADGTARCWGANVAGQLGDGTMTEAATPVPVRGLSGTLAQLVAGDAHTCALLADGTVRCWGRNQYGQLGDGIATHETCSTGDDCSPTPVAVTGLEGTHVTQLAAGDAHTCALLADGTARCWGYNINGQLGNGARANSVTPVAVTGLGGAVTQLAAGTDYTCALLADGTVRCWGYNYLATPTLVAW